MPLHRSGHDLVRALSASPASSLSCRTSTPARVLLPRSLQAARTQVSPLSAVQSRRPDGCLPSLSARPGSVLPLAAPSPSLSLVRHVQRPRRHPTRPSHGAGPLIRRFKSVRRAAASRPQSAPASMGRPLPACNGLQPERQRAACAGQRPANVTRSPGGWRGQPAHRGPSVAPSVSTRCWLMGRQSRQPSVSAACVSRRQYPKRAKNHDLNPALLR